MKGQRGEECASCISVLSHWRPVVHSPRPPWTRSSPGAEQLVQGGRVPAHWPHGDSNLGTSGAGARALPWESLGPSLGGMVAAVVNENPERGLPRPGPGNCSPALGRWIGRRPCTVHVGEEPPGGSGRGAGRAGRRGPRPSPHSPLPGPWDYSCLSGSRGPGQQLLRVGQDTGPGGASALCFLAMRVSWGTSKGL